MVQPSLLAIGSNPELAHPFPGVRTGDCLAARRCTTLRGAAFRGKDMKLAHGSAVHPPLAPLEGAPRAGCVASKSKTRKLVELTGLSACQKSPVRTFLTSFIRRAF